MIAAMGGGTSKVAPPDHSQALLAALVSQTNTLNLQLTTRGTGRICSVAKPVEGVALGADGGFSVEDTKKRNQTIGSEFSNKTPEEVLVDMQKGNTRFWTGNSSRSQIDAFERRALTHQQHPAAAVLGCADSRVPTETVFDQRLGDLFAVRVAGNIVSGPAEASLQYAINHVGVKLVIVMGHECCGAVKAAQLPKDQIAQQPAALSSLLTNIKSGLDEDRLNGIQDPRAADREASVINVKRQILQLARDDGVRTKIKAKTLIVVGAFYEITSGHVDFFHEVNHLTIDDPYYKDTSVRRRSNFTQAMVSTKDEFAAVGL